jgi:hypothetical protein
VEFGKIIVAQRQIARDLAAFALGDCLAQCSGHLPDGSRIGRGRLGARSIVGRRNDPPAALVLNTTAAALPCWAVDSGGSSTAGPSSA